MMRALWLFWMLTSAASAAPLYISVHDTKGRPVSDAVVLFYPATGGVGVHPSGKYVVSQQGLQFHPFVSIVPVGATVSFPNLDPTKHHVYSFSPAKPFELKLFAKDQSRSILFDRAGAVALGCNIHDQMSAFIYVTDTRFAGRTNGRGEVSLERPPGAGRLVVWHPYSRAPNGALSGNLAAGQVQVNVGLKLRPPPPAMMMKDY